VDPPLIASPEGVATFAIWFSVGLAFAVAAFAALLLLAAREAAAQAEAAKKRRNDNSPARLACGKVEIIRTLATRAGASVEAIESVGEKPKVRTQTGLPGASNIKGLDCQSAL
jgi:hypothetical protein